MVYQIDMKESLQADSEKVKNIFLWHIGPVETGAQPVPNQAGMTGYLLLLFTINK